MTRRPKQMAARASIMIVGALCLWLVFKFAVYYLAFNEDSRCFSNGQRSRHEIESCLYLYTTGNCLASERIRGHRYGAGTCVSYRIGGFEPIHVIYDPDGMQIERISAYE